MILGCTLLVVAMYVPAYSLPCIFGGAMLIGVGCAAFFVIWQRFFSAQSADTCSRLIILGTGVAPAIYTLIRLAPVALTAFLIPLVFVPLCGLSLLLSTQRIDFNQPMFEDNPRAHPQVYKKICSDSWKSALCVGSLGLADGAIRAIALSDRALESALGIGFMIGTLAAATAFFFVWRRLSFRFDIVFAFQLLFPFIITGFISLPFLGHTFVRVVLGVYCHDVCGGYHAHGHAVCPNITRPGRRSAVRFWLLRGYRVPATNGRDGVGTSFWEFGALRTRTTFTRLYAGNLQPEPHRLPVPAHQEERPGRQASEQGRFD